MAKSLFTIVGMKYRGTEALVASLQRGDAIALRRDPHNQHDANAIEAWYGGTHIGFIKADEAKVLAEWMDNHHYAAIPAIFTVTADRWPQVEVEQ